MGWTDELTAEWLGDLGRFVQARAGRTEDWLLARKSIALLSAVGSVGALITALVIPAFSDARFAAAYGALLLAAAGFAVVIAQRTATVMKFETGPRLLDIPRLSRALSVAGMLVLPCVVLQIMYPLRLVAGYQSLTGPDVKPVLDLVGLYVEFDRDSQTSIPTSKGPDGPLVDPDQAKKILDGLAVRTKALNDQASAAYDGIIRLLYRYPDLASETAMLAEQTEVNQTARKRMAALADMGGPWVSGDYKAKLDKVNVQRKQFEQTYGDSTRMAALMASAFADRIGVSDTRYRLDLPETHLTCTQPDGSFGCRLIYRLEILSRLRKRSWGENLVGALSPSAIRADFFAPSLVASLFGWQGVLPILAIAATFGILLRIVRLTDRQAPYVFALIGIIGIVLWDILAPTKTIPPWLLETVGLPDVAVPSVHFSMVVLPPLLLVVLAFAAGAEPEAGANSLSTRARCVRVAMIGLPAIALVMLTGWGPTGGVAWLLIIALVAMLIALIPWLDRLMLEANCSPRVG